MPATPPVTVRRSRIQGRGVYASRAIATGDRIIEYTGARISADEADALCADESMQRHHTFLFAVDDDVVIDATRGGSAARFINHSCDPNCESVIVDDRVFIEALRPIRRGEELVYDYWYVVDASYTLADLRRIYPCRCKAETCRGTLARPPPRKRRRKAATRTR